MMSMMAIAVRVMMAVVVYEFCILAGPELQAFLKERGIEHLCENLSSNGTHDYVRLARVMMQGVRSKACLCSHATTVHSQP